MQVFNVPIYTPPFNPGIQLTNWQQGGPSSHPHEQSSQPRIYPMAYAVGVMGIGNMPRQVIGPTNAITSNQLSDAVLQLEIQGIFKTPLASAL